VLLRLQVVDNSDILHELRRRRLSFELGRNGGCSTTMHFKKKTTAYHMGFAVGALAGAPA
jgi:hypothetical protein